MDFSALNSLNLTSMLGSNNTANPLALLPSAILESFLPGYSFLSQLILRLFGIDIALVVAGGLLLVGLQKAIMYLWYQSYGVFSTYFVSSVHIEKDDEMFTKVMEWVAEQRMAKEARHVRAVTKFASAWDDDEETSNLLEQDEDLVDERGMFNFEKWASNIPPRFEPTHGNHRFWHQGRLFFFERAKKDSGQKISWYNVPEDEYLVVSCIGRRPEPVKEWLNHVKNWSLGKDTKYTSIRRACARSEHSETSWDTVLKRPSRPMQTVILDKTQKMRIVEDINEYLHPATARWYAARGIPYRRGYLFYGPPGTGKTSLSFALAGIFGLDIYCISLMEPSLKESDLLKLFSELPRRCIVLLEDIDSAGLRRSDGKLDSAKADKKADKDDKKSKDKDEDVDSGVDLKADDSDASDTSSQPSGPLSKRAVAALATARVAGPQSQISLSGLLNAIDGVATHEGRVLIMTTNHVENLDAALLRPGRVDMQIKFTLATRQQARDIFIRMYSVDESERARHASQKKSAVAKKKAPKKNAEKKDEEDDFADFVPRQPMFDMVEPEELRRLAQQFAEAVPENKFSPAELQGFLLMRKKEPSRAVEEIADWRDRTLAAKQSGMNVIDGV